MPLVLSSLLMKQQYGTIRKRKRKFSELYVSLLHKVCNETMVNMEKWLNL